LPTALIFHYHCIIPQCKYHSYGMKHMESAVVLIILSNKCKLYSICILEEPGLSLGLY
jgi:hypothetical protein